MSAPPPKKMDAPENSCFRMVCCCLRGGISTCSESHIGL